MVERVKCIDNKYYPSYLSTGKEYDVLGVSNEYLGGPYILVEGDNGKKKHFSYERFVPVKVHPSIDEVIKDKEQEKMNDMVNHPKHYTHGMYEPIEVIEDWGLNFCLGNALKYISRCNHKGSKVQDLEKAIFYIKKEIDRSK